MRFLDLFSGIGGFRLGMQQAGHECVGYVEIDKFARKSYQAIHDTEGEWTASDIRSVTDDDIRSLGNRGHIDIICGGFPCQAFSIAGKRGGFNDTRGTLFFEIARFTNILRPRYLFLENVKGLLNHNGGDTFETIIRALDELGYDAEWDLLNSKNFGVPQNRERVFIVGHLRGTSTREVFPLERNDGEINPTKIIKVGNIRRLGKSQSGDVVSPLGIAPTMCSTTTQKDPTKIILPVLTPDRVEKRQNGRRFKEDGEPMFTLTAQDKHGVAILQKGRGFNSGGIHEIAPTLTKNSWEHNNHLQDGFKIRKLTPRECWRLQGFPDWAFDRAKEVNSDSQLYKQAGNSVTVNVIYEIAKRLGVDE